MGTSKVFERYGEKSAETLEDHPYSTLGQAKSPADISNVFTFFSPIYDI
jgi:hypothetical protein